MVRPSRISGIALVFSLLLFQAAASIACEAHYDSSRQSFWVPCISIDSLAERYSANFKQNEQTFTLANNSQSELGDAYITDVQVLTAPYPVAIVFFGLANGCTAEYQPASKAELDFAKRTITIAIKTYSTAPAGTVCTQMIVNSARAFPLSLGYSPDGNNTYTITAQNITKTITVPSPFTGQ